MDKEIVKHIQAV